MICESCWEKAIAEGDKLFESQRYLAALEKYKDLLPAFHDLESLDPWMSMQQLQSQIDLYIVSCHKVSETLLALDGSTETLGYAYRPISLLKEYLRELNLTHDEAEFMQKRLAYSLKYYDKHLLKGHPKLAQRISFKVRHSA